MIPFLEPKRTVTMLMSKRGKDAELSPEHSLPDENGAGAAYRALAEDMISAMQNGSVQDLASCLQSLCDIMQRSDEEQDSSLEHPSEG